MVEFGGVLLQQLRKLAVRFDADRLHPLVDAAGQTRSLVRGKVEPAAALEVFEKRVELSCTVCSHDVGRGTREAIHPHSRTALDSVPLGARSTRAAGRSRDVVRIRHVLRDLWLRRKERIANDFRPRFHTARLGCIPLR